MQTPLQRLIEIIGWRKTAGEELELPDSDPGMIQINLALRDATELLEKEKEVICKAFSDGKHHGANGSNPNDKNKRYNYLTSQYWKDAFTDTNK